MKKLQLIIGLMLLVGQLAFSQQEYSWEDQAKEILLRTDELLPDTADSVVVYKESLQSLIRESFQTADSYKRSTDSLSKVLVDLQQKNAVNETQAKKDDELKLYIFAGAVGITLILLILLIVFIIRSSKMKSKVQKIVAEIKEKEAELAHHKLETEQQMIKMERLDTELKDSLDDSTALNNKNKELIAKADELQKSFDEQKRNAAELSSKNSEQTLALNNAKTELSTLQEKLEAINKRQLELESEKDKLNQSLSDKENEIRTRFSEMEGKLKASEEQLKTLEAVKADLEGRLASSQNNYAGFEEQLLQQKQVCDTLSQEKMEIATELTGIYNKNLSLQADNDALKAEMDNLQKNMEKEVDARLRIDKELEKFVEELKGFLPLP